MRKGAVVAVVLILAALLGLHLFPAAPDPIPGPGAPPAAVRTPVLPETAPPPATSDPADPEEGEEGPISFGRRFTEMTVRVLRAEDRAPLPPGVAVALTPEGSTPRRAETGAEGTVRFEGLPDGRLEVVALAPGRVLARESISQGCTGGGGTFDEDGALLLLLERGVALPGVVLAAADRRPVPGARVTALPGGRLGDEYDATDRDESLGAVETDAEGRFLSAPVPAGRMVTLLVEHPAFLEADRTLRPAEAAPHGGPLEFLLEAAASVRGIVLGPDGATFEGAEVRALPIVWNDSLDEEDRGPIRYPANNRRHDPLNRDVGGGAISGRDGRFEVSSLAPGQVHRVYAKVGETMRSPLVEVTAPAAGQAAACDLRLLGLSRVLVRVEGLEGPLTEDVRLTLAPAEGPWPEDWEKTAEDDGRFVFEEVLPGAWRLKVEGDGYAPAEAAVLVPESRDAETTVRLGRGLAIEGVVVDDAGEPIPGREVLAYRLAGDGGDPHAFDESESYRSVKADTAGRFRVEGLRAGFHSLFLAGVAMVADFVRVEAPAAGVRLVCPRTAAAVARLVFPDGAEVPRNVGVSDLNRTDVTFDGRSLLVEGIQAGRNAMAVEPPGFARIVRSFEAKPGETVDLGEIAFSRGVTVPGRVVDPLGKPVAGAKVEPAWGIETPSVTDAEGRFRLEHLPEGEVLLDIRAEGWPRLGAPATVAPGMTEVVVSLVRGGAVRGTARREGGPPVPVSLCFYLPGQGKYDRHPEAHADEKGRFEIHLAPGRYRAACHAPGGREFVRDIEVAEGSETTLDFTIPGK